MSKLAWIFGNTREILRNHQSRIWYIHRDYCENLLEILAVAIVLGPISSVCGGTKLSEFVESSSLFIASSSLRLVSYFRCTMSQSAQNRALLRMSQWENNRGCFEKPAAMRSIYQQNVMGDLFWLEIGLCGLFWLNVGLFWLKTGLFCKCLNWHTTGVVLRNQSQCDDTTNRISWWPIFTWNRAFWTLSAAGRPLLTQNRALWRMVGLVWPKVGFFWYDIGLFGHKIGLICHKVGLFWEINRNQKNPF